MGKQNIYYLKLVEELEFIFIWKIEKSPFYSIVKLPGGVVEKNLPANSGDETEFDPLVWKIPCSKKHYLPSIFPASESGISPTKESASGKYFPGKKTCLENSKDRGAWWATVQGVARVRCD